MPKEAKELLKKLEYNFKNIEYLDIALTHSSFVNEHILRTNSVSNERFEFLGDAVLDLIIGEYFFKSDEGLREGKLSKLRSEVVNERSLAKVSKELKLGSFIKFGKGELKSGGNNRESILADALEALIGAIYLDSNLKTVNDIVLKLFENILKEVENKKNFTDYKSRLQENLQHYNKNIVEYVLDKEEGPDNNKVFHSLVKIDGKIFGSGSGKTKKKSEQIAAKRALLKLGEKNV